MTINDKKYITGIVVLVVVLVMPAIKSLDHWFTGVVFIGWLVFAMYRIAKYENL